MNARHCKENNASGQQHWRYGQGRAKSNRAEPAIAISCQNRTNGRTGKKLKVPYYLFPVAPGASVLLTGCKCAVSPGPMFAGSEFCVWHTETGLLNGCAWGGRKCEGILSGEPVKAAMLPTEGIDHLVRCQTIKLYDL